jgi:hypothetical protein
VHGSNVVLMISDDRLNRGSFFLGSHAGTYGVRFCPSNKKNFRPLKSWFSIPFLPNYRARPSNACAMRIYFPKMGALELDDKGTQPSF